MECLQFILMAALLLSAANGSPIPVPRVEDMTLAEKVGQMAQVDKNIVMLKGADILTKYFLGAVVSGGGARPPTGNTPADWRAMIGAFQAKANATRLRVPLLYGIDAIHGHNNVYGATIFPHHVGLGAARDPGLAKAIGAAAAKEVAATGIRWTFAPNVAVCKDPRWGRCYESFGESTRLATAMTAEVDGWQEKPMDPRDPASELPGDVLVAATAKHFVGDGGTTGGRDEGDTAVPEAELRRVHLPPFRAAVARGVAAVMISYQTWNGAPMHGNKYLITDVLKGELGFGGVAVSDWEGVQRLWPGGSYAEKLRIVINAGMDIVMLPNNPEEFTATLIAEVAAGRVPEARVDNAVRRILALKEKLGLFQDPVAGGELAAHVGSPAHRQLARRAVRESLVLLKNARRSGGGPMFPLAAKGRRFLVGGTHAHNMGYQCGGWTIAWQGLPGDLTPGTTILDAIRAAVEPRGGEVVFPEHPAEEAADVAILAVGEAPYAETLGDAVFQNPFLGLDTRRINGTVATVTQTCARMPCVVLLLSGRPLDVRSILPHVDALVAAWLPGTEGGGVADVLFGDADFTGRLPVSWFRDVGQLPLRRDGKNYDPLFPFGFGLDKSGRQLAAKDPFPSSSCHLDSTKGGDLKEGKSSSSVFVS